MIKQQPRIGIILVHINAYEHTSLCLRSLRNITYREYEIIVVDNGSTDNSGSRLRDEFPEATHIRSETNEGATGGNNIAIEYALVHNCEHVLLINNDAIATPSFIEPLIDRLLSDPKIGAISGKIYYYPQAVGGRENVIWYAGAYQKWHMAYNHYGDSEVDSGKYEIACETAFTVGCLMLIRGEAIKKTGVFLNDYFIYWEEPDWCIRASEHGYSSWYEPRSLIYHNTRAEVRGKESPLFMYMHFRNFLIFAKHHFKGIRKLQFWFVFPIHILKRWRICAQTGNTTAINAMFKGVVDYFKGYSGKMHLKERGLIKN
jgi:GT2 family glycosyltransferase